MSVLRKSRHVKGASTIEYGLITLFIGAATIGVVSTTGVRVSDIYTIGETAFVDGVNGASSSSPDTSLPTPFDGTCEVLTVGNDTSSGTADVYCYDFLTGVDNLNMSTATEAIGVRAAVDDDAGIDTIRLGSGNDLYEGGMRLKFYGGLGDDTLNLTENNGSTLLQSSNNASYDLGAGNDTVNLDASNTTTPVVYQIMSGLGNDTVNASCGFREFPAGPIVYAQEGFFGRFTNCAPNIIIADWDGGYNHNVDVDYTLTERFVGNGSFAQFKNSIPSNVDARITGGMDSKWDVTMEDGSTGMFDIDMADSKTLWMDISAIDAASSISSMDVDADLNHMFSLRSGTKVSPDWNITIPNGNFKWTVAMPFLGAKINLSDWVGQPNFDLSGNTPEFSDLSINISEVGGTASFYSGGSLVRSFQVNCGASCSNWQRYGVGYGAMDFDEIRVSNGADTAQFLFNAANPKLFINRVFVATK
jgi:Flp pilus assembly pilin Flp